MLRSPLLVLFVALAVLVGEAASAAARVVVAPEPVSPRGRIVQDLDVAVGGNRTVVLMVTYVQTGTRLRQREHDWAVLARVGAGSRPGRLQRLSGGGGSAGGMDVAVGGDGTAVAAWVDDNGRRVSLVRVAVAAPGRSFAPPQTIARVSTRYSHQLAGVVVTASGRAVVAWSDPEDARRAVRAAIREPGKRFGPPITLDPGRLEQPEPVVAATPWGSVLVGWSTFPPPPTEPAVLARTLRPGAKRFGAPVTLTQPPAYFPGRLAAVSGTGGAGVTWQQQTSNDYNAAKLRMFAALTRDGRFVTGKLPFPIAELTTGWDTLQLALPSSGRVVAAWADMYGRGTNQQITSSTVSTSTRPPGSRSFSPVRRLSASGWIASPPALGVLGNRTVAAWTERRQRTSRLRVAVRPDRGGWTKPQTIPGARAASLYAAGSRQRVAIVWAQQGVSAPLGAARLAWVTR